MCVFMSVLCLCFCALVDSGQARPVKYLFNGVMVHADSTKKKKPGPKHFEPVSDRWRGIQPPPYQLNKQGSIYDPYNQNILKGDYPIIGQNIFLILTASTDNFAEAFRVPTMTAISTQNPQDFQFFGNGDRFFASERLRFSVELYKGNTAYRPRDWELKATPVFNLNYISAREISDVNLDERQGTTRYDDHLGFQELFFEKHLLDLSASYDFIAFRGGIQQFNSDFRGFVFQDFNLGARLFGNAGANRYQYNLGYFYMLEKDTNSGLNTLFEDRNQQVLIANLYKQDFLALGYTAQLSLHYNHDKPSFYVDENGVPVRPAVIGANRPHEIKAFYLGWTGDGHFGRLNITHALYQVFGSDSFNSLAGRRIALNAQMAALELSYDRDWMRFRVSGFYASGDRKPLDGFGNGFDTILDVPFFAGGPFSYWNSQQIRLFAVNLANRQSLVPNLRSSKIEGQANFVNPGLLLANLGYDAELTPKLRLVLNANYLRFVTTAPLTQFVNQTIRNDIGLDYGLGLLYRPFLNNNAIFKFGVTALTPLQGFNDLFDSPGTQYAVFALLQFTY
jgi:hypothetical protein